MINLEWVTLGGERVRMDYDATPGEIALAPAGAIGVRLWLGTTAATRMEIPAGPAAELGEVPADDAAAG